MTTEISPINTANFAEMARAMGMGADMSSGSSKASTLPRLRIWNSAIMGQVEVNGKKKNMEVIPEGTFRLQMPDDSFVYAEQANIRVFVQRFMHKHYDDKSSMYVKTIMGEDLNSDLKDNAGTFNCGKPAGYLPNYNDYSKEQQEFFQKIRRTRVLLGEVELVNPVDAEGNEVEVDRQAFIWEVDNREGFKAMGEPFAQLGRQKRLPVQHWIKCTTVEGQHSGPVTYYVPVPSLDLSSTIDLEEADQQRFQDFIDWIGNYNQYILNAYNEKAGNTISNDDASLVEQFVDIDGE
jgi:hypothetical protein